ncbi:hypothetical protein LP419_25880 [Massilia sp. H-1]|nr:hypothetical protein LP419_25880 [Massilia sp. H-1]
MAWQLPGVPVPPCWASVLASTPHTAAATPTGAWIMAGILLASALMFLATVVATPLRSTEIMLDC